MRIDVLSLFPEMITSYCKASILGIALEQKLYELHVHNPRDYTVDKHRRVDDTPCGGGAGMLLQPQPFVDCLEAIPDYANAEIIVTSPSGRRFDQKLARELSEKKHLVILCGRYEGFDQRIRDRATMEISVGDYVLTGGELPALTMIDATLRHLPGVLGDAASMDEETHTEVNYLKKLEELQVTKKEMQALLEETGLQKEDLESLKLSEYPHYTRPVDFRGQKVPEVLLSGDHKAIMLWRLKKSLTVIQP